LKLEKERWDGMKQKLFCGRSGEFVLVVATYKRDNLARGIFERNKADRSRLFNPGDGILSVLVDALLLARLHINDGTG
jgi:hypothetical protein